MRPFVERSFLVGALAGAVSTWALMLLLHGEALSPSDRGAAELHFAPDENLEAIDVGLIGAARVRIDIAAYVLTDRPIAEALASAAKRGVKVRVWQDAEEAEHVGAADIAVRLGDDHPGLEIRYKPPGPLMHLKGYCVDGETFRSGSANFSRSGETQQDNDLIILRSREACDKFEAKFEKIWGTQ